MNTHASSVILQRQYKDLLKNPVDGFFAGIDEQNMYKWDVVLMGPNNTIYEGGMFKGVITFPYNYPNHPPKFQFTSPIYHPNIYKDGLVCISILHPPGEDEYGYEDSAERWRPIHNVQSIILSIISLLSDPNTDSPANIEASKLWKNNKKEYKTKVKKCVRLSHEN